MQKVPVHHIPLHNRVWASIIDGWKKLASNPEPAATAPVVPPPVVKERRHLYEDIMLYAKGHYVEYSRNDVHADLCVIFGNWALMEAEYYERSPKDVMYLLIKAFYELRGGVVPEREIQEIIAARYNWLGEDTIPVILSFFTREKMLGENDEPLRPLPELNLKLQEKLKLERSLREVRRVSADRETANT